ncbi:MAG TPA: hypothetical protein VFB99_24520, partial [Vicinamibacterales bacterium]|nr:hypothetical protein [Vicinamibacterales bacterium]
MTRARLAAMVGALAVLSISVTAQQGQAPAPIGGGRIGGIGAYPQRTEDTAAVERGRATFSTNCAFCHGAD